MIDKKMFLQGHLDEQETCVIVTDEMYQQYLLVQKQAEEREIQEKASREQKEKLPEEYRQLPALKTQGGEFYLSYSIIRMQRCHRRQPRLSS